MTQIPLEDCTFPQLNNPYNEALRQAVTFILNNFDVLGIIASGTIIRGNPLPTSDLDMYVIHSANFRQRLQRFFNGVPSEIFVNTLQTAESYITGEIGRGRPSTAHMLATGFVIVDRDPDIERLRQKSSDVLNGSPNPTPDQLRWMRYGIATQVEDALDVQLSDPDTSILILSTAVHEMLQYAFWNANQWLPRDKDLLDAATKLDPKLGEWGRAFFAETTQSSKIEIALKIVDATIQTRGFFEWDSDQEKLD